jgi:hypothetical protein
MEFYRCANNYIFQGKITYFVNNLFYIKDTTAMFIPTRFILLFATLFCVSIVIISGCQSKTQKTDNTTATPALTAIPEGKNLLTEEGDSAKNNNQTSATAGTNQHVGNTKLEIAIAPNAQPKNDTPQNSVFNFLMWYKQHVNTLASIPIVKNIGANPPKNYEVDMQQAGIYQESLRNSGYLSDKYLTLSWLKIKQLESTLKRVLQTEGVVEDMDYDWIMHSQDFSDDLNKLQPSDLQVSDNTAQTATVKIVFPVSQQTITYQLSKKGKGWLVDNITP